MTGPVDQARAAPRDESLTSPRGGRRRAGGESARPGLDAEAHRADGDRRRGRAASSLVKAADDLRQFTVVTLNGITLAALYFVVASGFTLIFGLMRVVNMAHGSLYLLGGYLALRMQESWFKDDSGLGLSLSGARTPSTGCRLAGPADAGNADHPNRCHA